MTMIHQTMWDEAEIASVAENSHESDPRTVSNDSQADHYDPADTDEEWDMTDLESRAEEYAFQEAHERGLIFF